MATDPLPQFSPKGQSSPSEETCLLANLAKDNLSLEVLAIPIAKAPPTLLTTLLSQDPVKVKNGPRGDDISNKNNHEDFQV